jgi:glutamyl-tRNA reductase
MAVSPIVLVGLSHRTAPIAVRERFSLDEDACRRILGLLRGVGMREAVVLSTCNRTELYGVGDDGLVADAIQRAAARVLAEDRGARLDEVEPHVYRMDGLDAVRHLFRVTSSLDSLVIGEPQILGQAKDAYRVAMEAGTVGAVLARFFEKAFKVAKEVRTTTGVGTGQVSVGSIAVDLARQVFGDLSKSTVLLLGAGKMAEAVGKTLAAAGARRVVVANRTVEKAMKVAETYGWSGAPLTDLPELIVEADVIIASLASPGYVIDRPLVKGALARRKHRAVFLVDIAVPRVIEPEVSGLEGAYLYNIDDFNQIVEEHMRRRSGDVHKADDIIGREVEGVERYLRTLEVQPLIAALGQRAQDLREREVARALKELGEASPEVRKVVEALATSLTGKLLHDPICVLREAAHAGTGTGLAEATRVLFRLEGETRPGKTGAGNGRGGEDA